METKHTCFGMVKGGDCEELTKQNPNLFGSSGWTKKREREYIGLDKKSPSDLEIMRMFMVINILS